MKQIVPIKITNLMGFKKAILFAFSMFMIAGMAIAQNPTNGGNITFGGSTTTTICPGETPPTITSTAPASGGNASQTLEYLWMSTTVPGATAGGTQYTAIPNSNSLTLSPGPLGQTTFFVRCARRIGMGNNPLFTAESNIVTVNVLSSPTATISGNPGSGFSGLDVTFTGSYGGPGATYFWNFGNGQTSSSQNPPAVTYTAPGTYNVTFTVTSSNGCETTTTTTVIVTAPSGANIADPCFCGNPLNFSPPGSLDFFNHDYVLVNSNPGETWILTPNNTVGGGLFTLVNGVISPITGPVVIPETAPGVYYINVWFNGALGGWQASAGNGTFNLTTGPGSMNPCPTCPQAPLPVELNDFKATVAGDNLVSLTWETGSETNNSHFDIERSLDAARFENIGTVAGNGTTSATNFYKFDDVKAVAGETYYRLKQVDLDGGYEYSDVLTVRIASDDVIVSVSPNPVKESAIVRLGDNIAPNTVLELLTPAGQVVRTFEVDNSTSSLEINISDLPEGIYMLSVDNASREQKAFYKVVKF